MKKAVIDDEALMLDWDQAENDKIGLDPKRLSVGSNKLAHWKCHICGNTWTTRIERKNKGAKCKACIARELTIPPKEKSLAVLCPKIASEWDYELNEITPDQIYPLSNKQYHWICKSGHRWISVASHRVGRDSSCPYCSGRKVLEGFNDLATTHPGLLKEWDYEKNDSLGIYPTQLSRGTEVEPYWKCPRGHSWRCAVYRRAINKEGCPKCLKERHTSLPEKAIAYYISALFSDCIENYHPKELKKFEIDVFVPTLRVGIEYDGRRWHSDVKNDKRKDLLCDQLGITLFRIRENGCPQYESNSYKYFVEYKNNEDLSRAMAEIISTINRRYGLSMNVDVDIERDNSAIIARTVTMVREKSIANSPLIKEWDREKNKGVDPSMIGAFSNRRFWWVCKEGHRWKASAAHRSNNRGCPYCSGQKLLKGYNDLASQYPELLKEWDYKKNEVAPDEVAKRCTKKVWWTCSKCGHSWRTSIYVRTGMGCGCPECKKKSISEKAGRKVVNLDTGVVYNSLKIAGEALGINPGCISNTCRGLSQTAGGYHWKYADN